jgi:hypothetical protein
MTDGHERQREAGPAMLVLRRRSLAAHAPVVTAGGPAAIGLGRPHPVAARRRVVLALLPLATGGGLTLMILTGVSLRVASAGLLVGGAAVWVWTLRAMSPDSRGWLRSRVTAGIRVGLPAVLAYDAARYGLVSIASLSFAPFHVFSLFGQALLGPSTPEGLAFVAGTLFHLANGLGFAIAYMIAVKRPNIVSGIAWALVLETAMLLLYPVWLGSLLPGEFVPVSIAGHVAYGSVLGVLGQRVVAQREVS